MFVRISVITFKSTCLQEKMKFNLKLNMRTKTSMIQIAYMILKMEELNWVSISAPPIVN